MSSNRYIQRAINEAAWYEQTFGAAFGHVAIPKNIESPTTITEATASRSARMFSKGLGGIEVHPRADSRSALCYIHSPDPAKLPRIAQIFSEAGLEVSIGVFGDGNDGSPIIKVAPEDYDKTTLIIFNPKDWPTDWQSRLEAKKPGTAQLSPLEKLQIAYGYKEAPSLPRLVRKSAGLADQHAAAATQPPAPKIPVTPESSIAPQRTPASQLPEPVDDEARETLARLLAL